MLIQNNINVNSNFSNHTHKKLPSTFKINTQETNKEEPPI